MANSVKRVALLSLFCSLGFSQQLITRGFNFTAAGVSAPIDNRAFGCMNWTLTFNNNGFSAISIQLESAPDASLTSTTGTPGTFVAFAGTVQTGTGLTTNPSTLTTQGTIQGIGYFGWVRANLTSATGAGLVTGVIQCEPPQPVIPAVINAATANVPVIGPTAAGSPPTSSPVLVAGTDATNIRTILTDALGRQVVTCFSGCAASIPASTYFATTGAAANGKAVVATGTDFFCIVGSGTKTVFITSLEMSAQAGSSTLSSNLDLVVRSTLDSGGTSTNLTAVPADSANAAATATITTYSANPAALGTAVGQVKANMFVATGSATNLMGPTFLATWSFGSLRGVQPLTLRGATQEACLNANGATSFTFATINVEWYEQ
jgi:hypothetical protein